LKSHVSVIISALFSKLEHFIMSNSYVIEELIVITHFYVGYVYLMHYSAIITSVMKPHDDHGETKHPCLRARCHNYVTHAIACSNA
jgi:hypothetical protein